MPTTNIEPSIRLRIAILLFKEARAGVHFTAGTRSMQTGANAETQSIFPPRYPCFPALLLSIVFSGAETRR